MGHEDMAAALLLMMQQVNIPASQARQVVELEDWLESIKDGTLVVSPAKEQ